MARKRSFPPSTAGMGSALNTARYTESNAKSDRNEPKPNANAFCKRPKMPTTPRNCVPSGTPWKLRRFTTSSPNPRRTCTVNCQVNTAACTGASYQGYETKAALARAMPKGPWPAGTCSRILSVTSRLSLPESTFMITSCPA